MLSWLQANLLTIVVGLILLLVVALIVRRLVLDKRAGKHICGGSCGSCGGGCGSCPMQGQCHGK
ncbi:MAG: FeoB-associated Cys-rich membrane protein [Oscillospiraceae bacterium]|nr:FeoB-associated Cys-rich membrane protein [Oscillospiraceae bacterium]